MAQETFGVFFREASGSQKAKIGGIFVAGILGVAVSIWAIRAILQAHNGEDLAEQVLSRVVELPPSAEYTYPYEIKSVSMAVMGQKGNRTAYAQFTLILDCPTEEAQKQVALHRAKLLDAIFEVGSQFYLEDFVGGNAPKSFEKFKAGLMSIYSKSFGKMAPRQVVFRDWFVN